MNHSVELIFALLFCFILNVAVCDEFIEVTADNSQVEPDDKTKYVATLEKMKKIIEEKETALTTLTAKFESYKKEKENSLKKLETSFVTQMKENQSLKSTMDERDIRIIKLKTRITELKKSLKSQSKSFPFLKEILDFAETKVFPACEKVWKQIVNVYSLVNNFVIEKYSELLSFISINSTCLLIKEKMSEFITIIRFFITSLWSQISPKLNQFYSPYAPTVSIYTAKASKCLNTAVQVAVANWEQFKLAFIACMKNLFIKLISRGELIYRTIQNSPMVMYTDLIVYAMVFGVIRLMIIAICCMICHVVYILGMLVRLICPFCKSKKGCWMTHCCKTRCCKRE